MFVTEITVWTAERLTSAIDTGSVTDPGPPTLPPAVIRPVLNDSAA